MRQSLKIAGSAVVGTATVVAAWFSIAPHFEPEPEPGYLGIQVLKLDDDLLDLLGLVGRKAVHITKVLPQTPAHEAGLKVGDVIVSYDGKDIGDTFEFMSLQSVKKEGERISLSVVRQKYPIPVYATLTRRPSDAEFEAQQKIVEASTVFRATKLELAETEFARRKKLDFYGEGTELWELGAFSSRCMISFLVPPTGKPIKLTGKSNPIHAFNKSVNLNLDKADLALGYVKFFNSHIWGEKGAFEFVESHTQVPGITNKDEIEFAVPQPKEKDGSYQITANIYYGDVLSEADLVVHPDGNVEMTRDKSIKTGIPNDTQFKNEQRCAASGRKLKYREYKVPPMIAGKWENVDWEAFQRTRFKMMIDERRKNLN